MSKNARSPRKAVLIVNAHSRRGRKLFNSARQLLVEAGIHLANAVALRKPAGLKRQISAAIDDGADLVIVGGGDGTISSAVDCFVGCDCTFAVLPLGTANSFARTLGIPLDLPGAVDVIAHGKREKIDLGAIDGDYFANVAAIGMPSIIAGSIPDSLKRILGRAGYILWSLWCLLKFHPFDVTLDEDGRQRHFRAVELRIANGSYLGGTEIAEDAELQSGDILIQVVTGGGRIPLAWNWLATSLRLPARHQAMEVVRGRSVGISTKPPLPISIDGEVTARTPVRVSVAKGVIDILVPASQNLK